MKTAKPHGPVEWLFENRKTGKITIMQLPNVQLVVFFVAAAVRRFLHPHGALGTAVSVIAFVALAEWAVDEILRGVNPFRRILGGLVLLVTIGSLVLRAF